VATRPAPRAKWKRGRTITPSTSRSRTERGRRTALAAAALGVTALLAGCGDDAWDGSGTAACPALPADVVAAVAGDLAAGEDAKGPAGRPPETGTLSPDPTDTGLLYGCHWATADGEGWGLQVTLESTSRAELPEVARRVNQWQAKGTPLTGTVQGQGLAYPDDGGRATWYCEFRVLDVQLSSPKEGTDGVTGAKRLAEALLPETGCAAKA
jgi:hypothetical protein